MCILGLCIGIIIGWLINKEMGSLNVGRLGIGLAVGFLAGIVAFVIAIISIAFGSSATIAGFCGSVIVACMAASITFWVAPKLGLLAASTKAMITSFVKRTFGD